MQLDVEESTPANIIPIDFKLELHLAIVMKLLPINEFWSSLNFGPVTDGQTDGQKVMPKSPPCISTGVLKKA